MSFISYFDLNKRTPSKKEKPIGAEDSSGGNEHPILDRKSISDTNRDGTKNNSSDMPFREQIFMYLGIVLGIVFSSGAMQMKAGTSISLDISVTSVVVSLIVGFVILPVAYKKLDIDSKSPILIRFGLAVQHGVFWQVLFGSLGKMIS